MSRDEIIKLAREAGILMQSHECQSEPTKLEQFAALIAAAEREECAKLFETSWREDWKDQQCAEAIRAMGPLKLASDGADKSPRYPMVYCSQCGGGFGPGDEGFSDCRNHRICCEGDCPYYGQPRPTSCACSRA